MVSMYLDIEKAYDTNWEQGVLKDPNKMGFREKPVMWQVLN